MRELLDHAGPILYGLAAWWYALTGQIPPRWRFS
jgi:hypothetical protein